MRICEFRYSEKRKEEKMSEENIENLPDDDDLNIISWAFRESLRKGGWDTDHINKFMEKFVWSQNNEDCISQAILILKNFGSPFNPDYFVKKYNQLWRAKKIKNEKIQAKKEEKKIIGKFNPSTIYENVEEFHSENPFFYDKNKLFWFWNHERSKWEIVDETDLLNMIEKSFEMKGQIVTTNLLNKYMKAFESIGRLNKPKEPNKNWIQFKSTVFNIKTKETFQATPEYFFCNSIPYDIGKNIETPTMDKLFGEWVGEKYIPTLYEIIAYCCLNDYPIHSLFCLIGSGRNGKSRFLTLINNFVGKDNCTATELDYLLDSRFESAKLFKKLVCVMGETNFGVLSKTSLLKKLTGQDLIGYEFKNKMPFDDFNYAKLLISSNSLPPSTDTSEGFYRRWCILDFPNNFPEGKDILEIIPEIEYENLALKVTKILPELLERGTFTNQGTIEERQKKYIMASNPLSMFIEEFCERGVDCYCKPSDLYSAYFEYLTFHKRRTIKIKAFGQLLAEEGIGIEHTWKDDVNGRFAIGVKLVSNWKEKLLCDKCDKCDTTPTLSLYTRSPSENIVTNRTFVTKTNIVTMENNSRDQLLTFLDVERPETEVFDFLKNCMPPNQTIQPVDLIEKMKSEGLIFEPRAGFLMKV